MGRYTRPKYLFPLSTHPITGKIGLRDTFARAYSNTMYREPTGVRASPNRSKIITTIVITIIRSRHPPPNM